MAIHKTAPVLYILCIMFGILYMFAEHKIFSFHNINSTRVEQILNWQTHIYTVTSCIEKPSAHIHSRIVTLPIFILHVIQSHTWYVRWLYILYIINWTCIAHARSLKIHFNIFAWEYKIFFYHFVLAYRVVCVCMLAILFAENGWDNNAICVLTNTLCRYNQIRCKEIIISFALIIYGERGGCCYIVTTVYIFVPTCI